jgi:hypothetical protein
VTGSVCEKVAQNVAQYIFLSKLIHNLYRVTKDPKNAFYVIFRKLPKVNNHPLAENSPNLVTLMQTRLVV